MLNPHLFLQNLRDRLQEGKCLIYLLFLILDCKCFRMGGNLYSQFS